MKAGTVAVLGVLLLACPAAAEIYGYSISASLTDPWVNQAAPQTGLYEVYIWLSCSSQMAYIGVFGIEGTLLDRLLGLDQIAPADLWAAGGHDYVWRYLAGPSMAPFPLARLFIFDPTGLGGALCLGLTDDGTVPLVSPDSIDFFPAAVVGFSNDGTVPCEIGLCEGPVSIEGDSWGKVKALYR